MVNDILIVIALFSSFAAIGAVSLGVVWMRKLRRSLANALNDAANQQIRTAQRLADAMTAMQRQQKMYEQQLHNLAQANARLKQDMSLVAQRLGRAETEQRADLAADRILH